MTKYSTLFLGIGTFILLDITFIEKSLQTFTQQSTLAKFVYESIAKVTPGKSHEITSAYKVELATEELTKTQPIILPNEILLNVPLLNQLDAPQLYNGCEVTSLAMLLHYRGIMVSKNELATKITRVPLLYQDGTNGNPNIGFVGNMEDGPGLGVYHRPIFQLAKSYASKVEDLTKQPFSTVMEQLAQGSPVWVITTTTFAPTTEIENWKTPQGTVDITYKMHSVVITGYDKDNIYINDPYGSKNKKVNKENFIKAWEQMGSQAIVLVE
jgi:uncharacterized protein YvpB